MRGVIAFDIAIKEGTEDKMELLQSSLRPAVLGVIQSQNRKVSHKLTQTDYTIMKQLLIKNSSMEIRDVSTATSISHKTIRRRLDKMIRNYVLEFSIQPNPDAMI